MGIAMGIAMRTRFGGVFDPVEVGADFGGENRFGLVLANDVAIQIIDEIAGLEIEPDAF